MSRVESPFSYVLAQSDAGWDWRVFDVEGHLVASGASGSQGGAQSAIDDVLFQGRSMDAPAAGRIV